MMQFGETDSRSRLLGLIGAMKDGILFGFDYKGIHFEQRDASLVAIPDGISPAGGRHLLKGATVNDIAEWIETKAEYYEA